ncbi:MAG TPA: PSD1 and planctomycete cytochrome C domain-containing protein [Planctomicrobium sp.]|nr:PSD1 and planctomycete cytochrome C domain-containing protein [Planctomicrobium sp.]
MQIIPPVMDTCSVRLSPPAFSAVRAVHSGSFRLWGLIAAIVLCLQAPTLSASEVTPEQNEQGLKFFEAKIRPMLIQHCADCHGADSQESNLRVDTYVGLISGGSSGPAVVPKNLDESLLISAINYKSDALKMPPDGRLSDEEIDLFKKWIEMGAPHPEKEAGGSILPRRGNIDMEEARRYWAFQPLTRPVVPEFADTDWVKNPVDAFILKKLKEQNLQPVPAADKRTLIRRATFDLTGLPPTPQEVTDFLADRSPEAFEKVLDRLMASPRYGERWGRHWLDVARYADSNGLDENQAFVDAWRYRDYVINAFNNDKPFNRFLMEQIAGDLIYKNEKMTAQPDGSLAPVDDDFELLIATGFLSLGPKVLAEVDPVKMEMDIIDEQIDAIGQAVLGLTLACARCHDHKFDPISAADYYAIAGVLKSTKTMENFKVVAKYNEIQIGTAEEREQRQLRDEAIAKKQSEIDELIKTANVALAESTGAKPDSAPPKDAEKKYPEETQTKLKTLRDELAEMKKANTELPTTMAVQEGTPTDLRIHVRGSHLTLGRQVPRGVPEILAFDGAVSIPENSSGRLEFARWLSNDQNPLTPRVAANRIWRWHFGEGLVPTTDNFGKLGSTPTHPELLDWLAFEFIERGWSFKAMHKLIMLSNTYQMSSQNNDQNALVDIDNKSHWRSDVRRLEAESIRDSLLAVSGQLDMEMGGPVLTNKKWELVFNHTSMDGTGYNTTRRSVYLPVIRNNLYEVFSLFDYSSADVALGDRENSTVAPQALFMMNSPLMMNVSETIAAELLQADQTDEARIVTLYERAFSRPPTLAEQQRFRDYCDRLEGMLREGNEETNAKLLAWSAVIQSLLASNEFLYVN